MKEDEADVPIIVSSDPKASDVEGVLRYPVMDYQTGDQARNIAKHFLDFIRQGTILALPNTKDKGGDFLWDFRIAGGDPGQVKIERKES